MRPPVLQHPRERFKDDVLAETAMQSEDALTELLIEEFEAKERKVYDAEDVSGTLPFSKVKRVLQSLSDEMQPLPPADLAVMSEAKTDEESEERMVDYTVFAPVAARIIYSMVDLPPGEARRRGGEAVAVGRGSDPRSTGRVHHQGGDPPRVPRGGR